MRKVLLSMEAHEKYEVIKQLSEGHITKQTASVKIGCTTRHVNRLLANFKAKGKMAFVHGNKGRKPAHTLSEKQKADIVTLYNRKYWDTNLTHCCELFRSQEGLILSPSCLRNILYEQFILSPKASRSTRKQMNQRLKALYQTERSHKEKKRIAAAILPTEDAHSRRPRCAYFGEMLQMDASVHLWFGGRKTQLHVAIDDCTGTIVGAYFDEQETLRGYYNVLYQVLNGYGIPNMFYTDNRTVFDYNKKKKKEVEHDTFTQFTYACRQLGIEVKTTSVAQAKGRVERLFQTLQSRLPVELRLNGVTTRTEANAFLNSYIKEYNAKFALPVYHTKSVFIPQPDLETIHQTLAVLTPRVVDNGHCIRFNNKYFKTVNQQGLQVHYHKGVKGLVIQTFTGELLFSTNDRVYALDEIPLHEQTSRNFDFKENAEKPRKRSIPSPKHPWRGIVFQKHVAYDLLPKEAYET